MQPWIDAPIAYPLLVSQPPNAQDLANWHALAAELDLPPVTWQPLTRDCRAERGALTLAN